MKKIIILSFSLSLAISLITVSPTFAKIRMVDGVLSIFPGNSAVLNLQNQKTISLFPIAPNPRGSMEIFSYPIVPSDRDAAPLYQKKSIMARTFAYGYNPNQAGDMKLY